MRYKEIKEAKQDGGDCFLVAGRNMMENKIPELMLVHALVHGQGPLKGRVFPHAWNELGDVVFDHSNGKNLMIRKDAYYKSGKVNPNQPGAFSIYDYQQFLKKVLKEKHWGPWDLDSSLEK